jgi:hypothetical protein
MLFKKITTETEANQELSSIAKPYLKRETRLYFLGLLIYVGNTIKSLQESF